MKKIVLYILKLNTEFNYIWKCWR